MPRPPANRSGAAICRRWSRMDFRPGARSPEKLRSAGARRLFGVLVVPVGVQARIDQLPAHQVKRRLVVELDIVERVGEDLGRPYQAGLDVLDEEQLDGAEQQPAQTDHEPDQSDVT